MTHGHCLRNFGLTLLTLWALAACGPSHELVSESQASQSAGFEAFESGVYALGNSKKCSNCHATNFNPKWVSPDPHAAYAVAKGLVDFKNPTTSILVEFASNNHCRSAECTDPATSELMKTYLQNWSAAELGQ